MADKTALQESAQALFCSMADNLGLSKIDSILNLSNYPDYLNFKTGNEKLVNDSFDKLSAPGVTLRNIEEFLLKNNDWYKSSVLIANELIKKISSIDPDFQITMNGYQNIFYFRGDSEIMGNIQKLFSIANKAPITKEKQASFGNINKWNPADIYFASKKASRDIATELRNAKTGSYNFTHLNILVAGLIDSGDLLPLSLKKTTSSVEIQKVNFNRETELEYLSKISFKSITDWKPYEIVEFPKKGRTRDLRIFLNNGGEIKLRHDPSAKRFVAEFIGGNAEARGGSIGSMKIFCELLGFVDKTTSRNLLTAYNEGEKKFNEEMKPLNKLKPILDKKLFDHKRGEVSAINITNKTLPIIKDWFNRIDPKSKNEIDEFIRIMFEYVTSRTELSSRFVIAK